MGGELGQTLVADTIATAPQPNVRLQPAKSAAVANDDLPRGLTGDKARRRLTKFGPNTMPDTALHPLRMALEKFWAPVPWMLEAAILLELALGKYVEATIIAGLLAFNAVLGLFQESRAQATLAALKSRLALNASVRRDSVWKAIPAAELVPGDVVKLSLGAVVAADARLTEGEVLLDQSMLTGKSVPIEAGAGVQTYAGALVRRGEAVAEVNDFFMTPALAAARARRSYLVSRVGRPRAWPSRWPGPMHPPSGPRCPGPTLEFVS